MRSLMEQLKISASAKICFVLGRELPFSHLEMVWRETWSFSARVSWERLARARCFLSLSLNFIIVV